MRAPLTPVGPLLAWLRRERRWPAAARRCGGRASACIPSFLQCVTWVVACFTFCQRGWSPERVVCNRSTDRAWRMHEEPCCRRCAGARRHQSNVRLLNSAVHCAASLTCTLLGTRRASRLVPMDPAPPGGAAAQQHPGQPQQPQGAGAAPSSAAAAASGSGAAPLAQLQNALNALHDLTQQQAPGGSGGEALARASAALQEAAVALQAQQPAAAAADADDAAADDGRAAKRARRVLEGPPPDFAYSPEAECDLIIKCGDGKRLGVHGLIVLRSAGLLRELLEACAGEREVRRRRRRHLYGRGCLLLCREAAGGCPPDPPPPVLPFCVCRSCADCGD